jgi:type I site-specific restriction endonuclease
MISSLAVTGSIAKTKPGQHCSLFSTGDRIRYHSLMAPEQQARVEIDRLLTAAGWSVQPRDAVDLAAATGIAICEFPLKPGHGRADYLLYVDGYAVGVIEAKKEVLP